MPSDDAREAAAQAVFEHWEFGARVAWVPGGNSLMQAKARAFADAALAAYRRHQREAGIVEVLRGRDYGIADAYVRGYVWAMENWPATLTQAKKAAADYEDKWQNGVIPNTLKQALEIKDE